MVEPSFLTVVSDDCDQFKWATTCPYWILILCVERLYIDLKILTTPFSFKIFFFFISFASVLGTALLHIYVCKKFHISNDVLLKVSEKLGFLDSILKFFDFNVFAHTGIFLLIATSAF